MDMMGMKTMAPARPVTPEGIIGSFVGKNVTVEYHGNKEARGILQGLGGGIVFLQQLDGRTTVVMMGSVIRITEMTTVQ